ncbi:hypothetical protein K505DRAFT_326819 [Melanomma pulvis-pyrius CBS 109.77]|uniref:Uncharacterized protein n=1 Tax=Melanomma pulvis-pyrius CBS 109.77 TaxID=1314802 RepID=A0A6A6X4S0_9PLEO|nr:hypothetical protein K505DRAFT_326819 [Melanomma pulvis-pyrius CBS 109.77]
MSRPCPQMSLQLKVLDDGTEACIDYGKKPSIPRCRLLLTCTTEPIPSLPVLEKGIDIADYKNSFSGDKNVQLWGLLKGILLVILLFVGFFLNKKKGNSIFLPLWFVLGVPIMLILFVLIGKFVKGCFEQRRVRSFGLECSHVQKKSVVRNT